MDDIPDDLTDVGKHQGGDAPTETGQTVRSPTGPDPGTEEASPSHALFQVVGTPAGERLTVQTYPPRTDVPPPDDGDEVGQYRTVDALRDGLADAGIEGWTAVFHDEETDRTIVSSDVTADHPWIGNPRYATVHLFADADAAQDYAKTDE